MVLLIGHDEEMDPGICHLHNIEGVLDEKLEYKHILGDTDVEGSLRTGESKTGALTTCQEDQCQIASFDGFKACVLVYIIFFCNAVHLESCNGSDIRITS